MSLSIEITSTLAADAARYERASQRADEKLRGINTRAARELLRLARSIVHVQTGRLRDGLILDGPFNIGTGTLEARISAPSVPYASLEAARGGEHDFAARTLAEGAVIITAAAQDMERALIAIMQGEA